MAEGRPVKQDWPIGAATAGRASPGGAATRAMTDTHAGHDATAMPRPAISYVPLDRVAATLRPLNLAAPVLIAPPAGPGQPWTAKSDTPNRPLRTDLTLDGDTGRLLSRKDFAQRRLVDRLVGYGVAIHEGQMFGWLNQLLNLLTATGLTLLAISSVVLWWRRRPEGVLGAPPAPVRRPVAIGLALTIVLLGVLLPLFGVTLLLVVVGERLILSRHPGARHWLGLRPSASA